MKLEATKIYWDNSSKSVILKIKTLDNEWIFYGAYSSFSEAKEVAESL